MLDLLRPLLRHALLALGVAGALASAQAPAVAPDLSARETFETAWRTIAEEHFDPELGGVDWDAVRDELLPRAEEASTTLELREVLREMLRRPGQSHFELIPKEALARAGGDGVQADCAGGAGFEVRLRDEELWVSSVEPGGPSAEAGVRTGWTLLAVDANPVAALLSAGPQRSSGEDPRDEALQAWRRIGDASNGAIGSRLGLRFRDETGEVRELAVERTDREVTPFDLPGLPTLYLSFQARVLERDGRRIGLLRFSIWTRPLAGFVARAMRELSDCDAIVIDLRGNVGGEGSLVSEVAGHFFAKRELLGVQRGRIGGQKYVARPRHPKSRFLGPVAILIDETTGSTSEVFAGGLQSVGRARVFGERSAGAVLPAHTKLLPNGDSLLHAIGDFRTADGTLLEGRGVLPDEESPLRREELLLGIDRPLEDALRWFAEAR